MRASNAASKCLTAGRLCATLFATMLLIGVAAAAAAPPIDPQHARVEVQIGVCDEPDHIIRALDLQPRGAPVETWLFDDAGLGLFNRGLRLRLRVSARDAELTLKSTIADCKGLSVAHVPADQGKCEYDVHGSTINSAVSLRRSLDTATARALVGGNLPLTNALSPAQVRYLDEVVHAWPLPADLRPLGPVQTQSYRGAATRSDVDVARLPAGERFIEISRKVSYGQAASANTKLGLALAGAGINACADQSAQAINKLRTLLRQPFPMSPAPSR